MLVGAQVVDPELLCPGFLGCWFAVEEGDIRFDALGVDLNCWEQRMGPAGRMAERAGANESRCRWADAERVHVSLLEQGAAASAVILRRSGPFQSRSRR